MAYDGINLWTPSRKAGGIPRVSTRSSLRMENERGDAGRDGRTCLARPNSQARTGTGKHSFFCSAYHEQNWRPYSFDLHSVASVDHTVVQKSMYYTQCSIQVITCARAVQQPSITIPVQLEGTSWAVARSCKAKVVIYLSVQILL